MTRQYFTGLLHIRQRQLLKIVANFSLIRLLLDLVATNAAPAKKARHVSIA